MYYICTSKGHIITSRTTKEAADNFVRGTKYFVRPSPEAIHLEEARLAYQELEAAEL